MAVSNKGKTAVVTGASRGIGRAIAEALLSEGYTVIGTSRSAPSAASVGSESLNLKAEYADRFQIRALDLTDASSIENFVSSLERADVLVNNAGSSQLGPVEEVPLEKMRQLYELIFFGQIRLIQGVLPLMRRQGGGRIINVTSLASHVPVPFSSVYASGKAAMEVLTRGLRNEVRHYGIEVTAIAPSFVRTSIRQERICPPDSIYFADYEAAKSTRDAYIANGCDPAVIARKVVKILKTGKPAPFYAAGKYAGFMAFLYRISSDKLIERLIRSRFKR